MARDKGLLTQERKKIHELFKELFSVKEHGVRKYDIEWIYAEIGQQFYKTPRTIKDILSKPLPEPKEENKQKGLDLFNQ